MSTAIFDALPGIETPVSEVRRALDTVWDADNGEGGPAASEFRASQMNLVQHFGLDATPEFARGSFEAALRFSHRYPCRILALCPRAPGGGGDVAAKIFSECYIGRSAQDKTCVEAIILTYPLEQRAYLENQASIMLESDLPVYYWPQRINRASRLLDYQLFLKAAHRVVIDSAIEKPEVGAFDWPRPESVRDLVFARMLPVRQSIGHFLSYLPPARILEGLEDVCVRHREAYVAEARVLAGWITRGMEACARQGGEEAPAVAAAAREDAALDGSLVAEWRYAGGEQMTFAFDFEKGTACLRSGLAAKQATVTSAVRLLAPEAALAEALFF